MSLRCIMALLALSVVYAKYCIPRVSEISVGGNIAFKTGQVTALECRVSLDFNKGMKSSNCVVYTAPAVERVMVIEDANANKSYTYDIVKKTCIVTPLKEKQQRCIPDGSKELAELYFGNNTLQTKTFMVTPQIYLTVNPVSPPVVNQDGENICIMVGASTVQQGGVLLSSLGYTDYSDGIKDPSVFNIPEQCNKEVLKDFEHQDFHKHIQVMSFL